MVCRSNPATSAATSFARITTGLADVQVISAFHGLRHEHRGAPAPTTPQLNAYLDRLSAEVASRQDLTSARRASMRRRIDDARRRPMDGQTFAAMVRITDDANNRSAALNEQFRQIARATGQSPESVAARFRELHDAAGTSRQAGDGRRHRPTEDGTPGDFGTIHALAQLREESLARLPSRTGVQREPVNSSFIRSIAHDPDSGRLEVEIDNRVYSYDNVTAAQYQEMRSAASVGTYYGQHIRGNPHHQYNSSAAAANGRVTRQCPACGQFAGDTHICRLNIGGQSRALVVTATPEAQSTHAVGTNLIRIADLNQVRGTALAQRSVVVPITATVTDPGGEGLPSTSHVVTGDMIVYGAGAETGQPYFNSFQASGGEASAPRCTCSAYRENGHCSHLDQAQQDLSRLLAMNSGLSATTRDTAIEQARRRAAPPVVEQTAPPTRVEVREPERAAPAYADDMRQFRRDYKAARDRLSGGRQVIPFDEEGRITGSNRMMGVELELDIVDPRDELGRPTDKRTALRLIGRALYDASLTPTPDQRMYSSGGRIASNNYSDEHERGWRFETDSTVDAEIISPRMRPTPESARRLREVCDIIKRYGGGASHRTGGHITIDTADYEGDPRRYSRLLAEVSTHEDEIYRLSRNPFQARGAQERGTRWCRPNDDPPANGYRSLNAVADDHPHGRGFALDKIHTAGPRVEIRTFDGSLDPAVIQAQMRLGVGLVEHVQRTPSGAPLPSAAGYTPLGSHRLTFGRRNLAGTDWEQSTAGFRRLVDKVTSDRDGQQALTSLFAANRWRENSDRPRRLSFPR